MKTIYYNPKFGAINMVNFICKTQGGIKMGYKVLKNKKICATCKYWGGLVRESGNNHVELQCNFYDKYLCLCRAGYNSNHELDFQKSCPRWVAKY